MTHKERAALLQAIDIMQQLKETHIQLLNEDRVPANEIQFRRGFINGLSLALEELDTKQINKALYTHTT